MLSISVNSASFFSDHFYILLCRKQRITYFFCNLNRKTTTVSPWSLWGSWGYVSIVIYSGRVLVNMNSELGRRWASTSVRFDVYCLLSMWCLTFPSCFTTTQPPCLTHVCWFYTSAQTSPATSTQQQRSGWLSTGTVAVTGRWLKARIWQKQTAYGNSPLAC